MTSDISLRRLFYHCQNKINFTFQPNLILMNNIADDRLTHDEIFPAPLKQ